MNQERPLKILMLASSYPRSKGDSAGIFLRHLAENLCKRGNQVHVLAPADKKGGTYLEDDVTVHRFQYFPARLQRLAYGSGILANLRSKPWLWIQVPFFLIALACAMLRVIRRERPDLIHGHWILPQGLAAMFVKLLLKIPVITTAHGGDAFALQSWPFSAVKRFVLRRSDAWTANTKATASVIGAEPALPEPRILPMGVDLKQFETGEREKLRRELEDAEWLILFVGRLVEKKGVANLLSGFALLPSEQLGRANLWIVGEGECRPGLEQQARNSGIADRVRFWGQVSNHLLPDFYAAADLFVAPSVEVISGDTEGQGVVFLEAFAARLCVLATRVGGISEVVEDGYTGVLVEPRNPHQLAGAIKNLLENPRQRAELAENALARVKRYYDWKKIAQDFEDLYRTVLAELR